MTTFQLLGIQFGVSESTANDTFNYWLPTLRELRELLIQLFHQ
ncbi:MAG: transposase family protein [Nostoc sp.]